MHENSECVRPLKVPQREEGRINDRRKRARQRRPEMTLPPPVRNSFLSLYHSPWNLNHDSDILERGCVIPLAFNAPFPKDV